MPQFSMEGLTEEQNSAIQSEIDRRVREAVETNTKNVTAKLTNELTAKYDAEYQGKLNTVIQQAGANAEEQTKQLLDAINQQQREFARERMSYKAERKLRDAGIADEAIDIIVPLLVSGANDESLENNLQAFIQVQSNAVEKAVKAQMESLAASANPPASGGGNPGNSNPDTIVNQILNNETVDPHLAGAQAIQYLIDHQE